MSIRVAVVGVGHMGRHHVSVYRRLSASGLCQLVAVCDPRDEVARQVVADTGVRVVTDVQALVGTVDAVSIAVPTVHHVQAAEPLLKAGIGCLIEKPLAASSALAQHLVDVAAAHGATLSVGHIERFNPVVRAVRSRGIRPRFVEAHRISPFSFRSADVSVVLDMMIHDIDVVLSLLRCEPAEVAAAGVAVIGRTEDVANARLTFPDGSVANLTASRLAIKTERKIRCFAPDSYVSMDYQKKTGIAITKASNENILEKLRQWADDSADGDLGALAAAGLDYTKLVHIDPLEADQRDQLEVELEDFLSAVRDRREPEVSGRDGLMAVRTAERIMQACRASPLSQWS